MPELISPQIRYRLNVTDSVKGVRTTDSTMELIGDFAQVDLDGFMVYQREFQRAVDQAYPPPIPEVPSTKLPPEPAKPPKLEKE